MRQIAEETGYSEGYARKKKFECKKHLIERIESNPTYEELRIEIMKRSSCTFGKTEGFLANRLSTEDQKAFMKEIPCLNTIKELKADVVFIVVSGNSGFYKDVL
ncbi:hypothetical protein ACSTS3_19875 [Aquimarina muelleri]|uniref:hypothetical protein n=1 Tax=Aquimarina muelleri TaxID=279356 RepID=UPI003F683DD9